MALIYKTIPIDQVENYPGWEIDKTFEQDGVEDRLEQIPNPAPRDANNSWQWQPTIATSKAYQLRKTYALIKRDSSEVDRERELNAKIVALTDEIRKLIDASEDKQLALRKWSDDFDRVNTERNQFKENYETYREKHTEEARRHSTLKSLFNEVIKTLGKDRLREIAATAKLDENQTKEILG